MMRAVALGLGAAAALALAGCNQNGSYRLSWSFYVSSDGSGPIESAAVGCGQHGVDSISATGSDETGDAVQVSALCTPGVFTGTAPPGIWTFAFHLLDSRGGLIRPPAGSTMPPIPPQTIASEGPPAQFSVVFVPRSACGDGVDNDGGGLVDTPGSECDGGQAATPDGGGPGRPDGATGIPDGAMGIPDGGTGTDGGSVGTPDGGAGGTADGGPAGAHDGGAGTRG
jgi:hypothetical protein